MPNRRSKRSQTYEILWTNLQSFASCAMRSWFRVAFYISMESSMSHCKWAGRQQSHDTISAYAVVISYPFAISLMFMAYSAPRLQGSSRVIWLWASQKFLARPKRHHRRTKTHGVWWLQLQDTSQCSIMAVHLGCITSMFLLLNGPFPCTSDLLILSHVAISQSQVQVRVAGGTVFVKRLGECRDSELNLEAELLSFIHGDDVKLRERQLNLVRITELNILT